MSATVELRLARDPDTAMAGAARRARGIHTAHRRREHGAVRLAQHRRPRRRCREAVAENRRLLRARARRCRPSRRGSSQVHGTTVAGSRRDRRRVPAPADAAITRSAGHGVRHPGRRLHAGAVCGRAMARRWRRRTPAGAGWRPGCWRRPCARSACPAASSLAWLGPAIGPRALSRSATRCARPSSPAMPQAAGGVRRQRARPLAVRSLRAGAAAPARARRRDVSGGGWCTYADPARFFSYRRDGQCGRMAALIWLVSGRGSGGRCVLAINPVAPTKRHPCRCSCDHSVRRVRRHRERGIRGRVPVGARGRRPRASCRTS